jgi:hypothetical protein
MIYSASSAQTLACSAVKNCFDTASVTDPAITKEIKFISRDGVVGFKSFAVSKFPLLFSRRGVTDTNF